MEQFNANPIRSGVGLTVTPPQTGSRSITPTESHKPDPRNLIIVLDTEELSRPNGTSRQSVPFFQVQVHASKVQVIGLPFPVIQV